MVPGALTHRMLRLTEPACTLYSEKRRSAAAIWLHALAASVLHVCPPWLPEASRDLYGRPGAGDSRVLGVWGLGF